MSKILNKELLSEIVETGKKLQKKNGDELEKTDDRMWLIYIDNKVINYERSENLAKRAMIKILETKLKEYNELCVKTLITETRNDKKCEIFCQSLGTWYNGSVEKVLEITIDPVSLFSEKHLVIH